MQPKPPATAGHEPRLGGAGGRAPAKGDCIESMSSGLGRPVTSRMRSSWFMVEVPGKMGLPLMSSPRMQPAPRPAPGWRAAQEPGIGLGHAAQLLGPCC